MAEVPLELPTGRVVGKFIFEVQDNNDLGADPQLVPVTGDITIKSAIDNLTIFDQTLGKFVTFRGPHKAILNSEGELATPDPTTGIPMYTGMTLWSNDSDTLSVKGWTYTATFNLKTADGRTLNLPPATFTLATGQVVDLADVVKVPATPGYGLPQAEGAALRAEAAAQVALDVKAMADAGEFDGAQGLPGNATMRVDTSVGTRVFISDGVTEKMVSGDTGWRNISSELINGWTGSVWIKRDSTSVKVEVLDLLATNATDRAWLNLPLGFMPSHSPLRRSLYLVGTTVAFKRVDVSSTLTLEQYVASDRARGGIEFDPGTAWPTELPGTQLIN